MTATRTTLRDRIRADGIARNAQHAIWDILIDAAHEAGMVAGRASKPQPMVVVDPRTKERWDVPDGVCGFAWVHITTGQRKFVNFLKSRGIGHSAYGGGWDIWCSEFSQSMERKEAYCRAYANVLRDGGITCHAASRMD